MFASVTVAPSPAAAGREKPGAEASRFPDAPALHLTSLGASIGTSPARSGPNGNLAKTKRNCKAGSKKGPSPGNAFLTWPTMAASRWAVIDVFERHGRRYVVAVEEKQAPALSTREREVLRSAWQGRCNKEIAHELRLAYTTITTLLARAAKKLGARSRSELLALVPLLESSGPTDLRAAVRDE